MNNVSPANDIVHFYWFVHFNIFIYINMNHKFLTSGLYLALIFCCLAHLQYFYVSESFFPENNILFNGMNVDRQNVHWDNFNTKD